MMEESASSIHIKKQSLSQRILIKLLSKIKFGKVVIIDGNMRSEFVGSQGLDTHTVIVSILKPDVYSKILLQGSIGAAESYMDGEWQTDDLMTLIEVFIKNSEFLYNIEGPIAIISNMLQRALNLFGLSNLSRSRKNIQAHYDLSNDFFKLFLDPTMMYSCAIYEPEHITQEQASIKKNKTICEYLRLKPTDHLLEIGSGWGGFAIYAAQNYGCNVTTTTISAKQYSFVKSEIERLGLSSQITLLNKDYRELSGQYDKLVSIEMLEAIGHKYYDTFFEKCNALLKPNGLLFVQTITINDRNYDRAKNEIDFIKKHIFPGGCLPSIGAIAKSTAAKTHLQLISLQDIGIHYVKTLMDWHEKFRKRIEAVKHLGFDDTFIRMWEFYFFYCAAGFKSRYISDIHALWQKPNFHE